MPVLRDRPSIIEGATMDKNRIDGATKQAKGSIKEALGKVTGDKRTELEGAAEKELGKVQGAVGKAADRAREQAKK
jgi:uncharacterized protein YjbJ (UPF0337 family)